MFNIEKEINRISQVVNRKNITFDKLYENRVKLFNIQDKVYKLARNKSLNFSKVKDLLIKIDVLNEKILFKIRNYDESKLKKATPTYKNPYNSSIIVKVVCGNCGKNDKLFEIKFKGEEKIFCKRCLKLI